MRLLAWFALSTLIALSTTPLKGGLEAGPALERIQIPANGFVFDALAAGPPEGDLVLLLHGFPQTSHSYRHQLRVLAEAGYRAVAPDQRGYSPGARPDRIEDYALARVVEDVFAIADALGRESFHLVGHDWGGAAAWLAATLQPARVRSLMVLSTPHFAAFGAALSDPESEQSRRSSYFDVFAAPGAEKRFLADDAAFFRSLLAGSGVSAEDVQVYVDALGTPEAMRSALNWYGALALSRQAAADPGAATAASKIKVATVYVWGELDQAFDRAPAEATGDFVEAEYRFVPLAGKGHWLPEQAADQVNRLLLELIEGSSRPIPK